MSAAPPAPLFVIGTARAGTNLLARLLSAHPAIEIAIDPYLPLLRAFRNAAIEERCDAAVAAGYTAAPFQDYYFSDERLSVMDAIQQAELDLPFDPAQRPQLIASIRARAALEAPDLDPLLERLAGTTYRELFDSALAIVADSRKARACRWVGAKEVWAIEFCAPLARAYAAAKFVVIVRDPRAVVASMHKLAEKDPTQRAHTLSYLRHWRKCAAFCIEYAADPLLRDRLHVVGYEDLVADPGRCARELCRFLEVDFVADMEHTEGFWDPATRSLWRGNSSYAERVTGIDGALAQRWRTTLEPGAATLSDLVCGPEMRLFGYEPVAQSAAGEGEALEFLLRDDRAELSWRSDLGDIQQDYGFELFRAATARSSAVMDETILRRCFLFTSVCDALRKTIHASCAAPGAAKHRLGTQ
jgi:hypothetical protein